MPERGPRRATALHYEGEGAPKVVASGKDLLADRILEIAENAGIPIKRDTALSEALSALELQHEIPEDLYAAVAETLAWAYSLDVTARKRR